jgi:hypothetical protein
MYILEMGWGGVVWVALARIGTIGELLWMQLWTFGFNKMLGNYQVARQLVASRVVPSSIELVSKLMLWNYLLCHPESDVVKLCIYMSLRKFPFFDATPSLSPATKLGYW